MRDTVATWAKRADTALILPEGAPLSYADLTTQALDFDDMLQGLGIVNQTAAVLCDSVRLSAIAAFATALENTFCPVSPAYRGARLLPQIRLLDATVVLTDDPVTFDAAPSPKVLIDGHDFTAKSHDLSGMQPRPPSSARIAMLTAGSSGTPKRIGYDMGQLANTAAINAAHFQIGPGTRYLCPMPLSHAHGLISILWVTLVAGGCVILMPGNLAATHAALLDHAPTCLSGVPTIHADLADLIEKDGRRPSGLRFARSSSAPLNYTMVGRIEQAYGCPLVETYGLTETTSVVVANALDDRRVGAVGRVIGDTTAAVLDQNKVAAQGQGELLLKGKSLIAPDDSDAFHDGWFRTGDLAEIDADGFIRIIGRQKEMIKRGGLSVFLSEPDGAIQSLPGVVAARSFALNHARLGEDLVAVVELAPGVAMSGAQILTQIATALPRYKLPSDVRVVDALPRTEVGKIVRSRVAETFAPLFATPEPVSTPQPSKILPEILEFCAEEMQVDASEITQEEPIFDTGALDSFSIEALLMLIDAQAGLKLDIADLETAQVASVQDLVALIDARQGAKTHA
ncbi:MAG: AMP-binding protein [Sedimentitalea sp.]